MTMQGGFNRRIISEINVTPMVDVMLVLLIIFMILTATPFKLGPARADHAHAPGAKRYAVGRAVDRSDFFQARGIESRD